MYNLSDGFDVYKLKSIPSGRPLQIFVAFSEKLNFNLVSSIVGLNVCGGIMKQFSAIIPK